MTTPHPTDTDQIARPTYDELMAEATAANERANRLESELARVSQRLTDTETTERQTQLALNAVYLKLSEARITIATIEYTALAVAVKAVQRAEAARIFNATTAALRDYCRDAGHPVPDMSARLHAARMVWTELYPATPYPFTTGQPTPADDPNEC